MYVVRGMCNYRTRAIVFGISDLERGISMLAEP